MNAIPRGREVRRAIGDSTSQELAILAGVEHDPAADAAATLEPDAATITRPSAGRRRG